MRDWATRRGPATLIKWAVLAVLVLGGIWAFGSGKPNQDMQLQVALRSAGDEQVELALYSTDHTGEALLQVPTNNILDLSQPRERRTYSDPIELPGSAPKAMVSVLSDSQYEFALGARVQKPNRAWSSSRFASREHLSRTEWESDDWVLLAPLSVRVNVNQPLLAAVRVAYYMLFALLFVGALTLFVWRRWLY